MKKAKIERAIDYYEILLETCKTMMIKTKSEIWEMEAKDAELVLTCLREALKRVEGCDWCKTPKKSAEDYIDNDPEGYEKQMETSWIAWASIGELVKTVSGEYGISACNGIEQEVVVCKGMTICPYCGRRLGEEARDG